MIRFDVDAGGAVAFVVVFLLGALFGRWLTRWREMRAAKARFLAAQDSPRLVEMFTPPTTHRPARTVREATGEADRA